MIKVLGTEFSGEISSKIAVWESLPFVRYLEWNVFKRYDRRVNDCFNTIKDLFKSHEKDYEESNERNICDAIITSRNTALREGKASALHLNDANLSMCMTDTLLAGADTTADIFIWALLFMTFYPEIQTKLRQEIETQIWDRIPTHEDRNRCNYVMAFITETLRMRNVLPIGVPHKTRTQTKICTCSFN